MKYFIKQLGEKDCGYTCVKMMLAMHYRRTDFLYYPEPSITNSSSLRDLMNYARKEGVTLGAYRLTNKKDILEIKGNIMLPLNFNNFMHMVVVTRIKKRKVRIMDPSVGVYWISMNELLSRWNGEYLEITKSIGSSYKAKSNRIIPFKYTILAVLFEVMSFLSLIVALYFIDSEISLYVSLSFFVAYVLFEFIYRKILVQTMKYFDKCIIVDNLAMNHVDFRTKYANLSNFKILAISNPLQFLSLCLLTVFGILVLGLNSIYNIIVIVIIVVFQLLFRLYEKTSFEGNKSKINYLENEINNLSGESNEVFKSKINELNNETYKYISYSTLKKYLLIFIIIAMSLLYSTLTKANSMNFMLFHFFFYLYLSDNIEQMINYNKNFDDYKYYKALYLFYFNRY